MGAFPAMNKAIGILGGLLLVGLAGSPANAVTVLATDVGASGTTQIQGSVDTFGGLVPGLTGTLFLEFDGVTNGGLTWNFDYFITNTTSIPPPSTLVARLSSFGLNVTPQVINPNGVVSTGLFSNVFLDPNLVFLGTVDFCASASGSGCSGGGGLLAGQSAGGEFTLTFSSVLVCDLARSSLLPFPSD